MLKVDALKRFNQLHNSLFAAFNGDQMEILFMIQPVNNQIQPVNNHPRIPITWIFWIFKWFASVSVIQAPNTFALVLEPSPQLIYHLYLEESWSIMNPQHHALIHLLKMPPSNCAQVKPFFKMIGLCLVIWTVWEHGALEKEPRVLKTTSQADGVLSSKIVLFLEIHIFEQVIAPTYLRR